MKRILKGVLQILAVFLFSLIILILVVSYFKIPIHLTRFIDPIEQLACRTLQRSVAIEKSIVVTTSLAPVVTLEGLRIGDDGLSAKDTFLYLDFARIQLELLPLLKKKLHLAEFNARQLELNLEERADGSVNWVAGGTDGSKEQTTPEKNEKAEVTRAEKEKGGVEMAGDSIVVKRLSLEDIRIHYKTPDQQETASYEVSNCYGEMLPGAPLNLEATGSLLATPYIFDLQIASLEEFLVEKRSWLGIKFDIAGALFTFNGNVDLAQAHQSLALQAQISGDNLSSLGELLRLDLPPIKKYGVDVDVFVKKNHLELKNLTMKTGSSNLNGSALVVRADKDHNVEIDLKSTLVQIDDFVFDDWSWSADTADGDQKKGELSEKTGEEVVPEQAEDGSGKRSLFDPELLAYLDVDISIRAEKVLSGNDNLGSGHLDASLKDGRIAVNPLSLQIPGGSIDVTASLKPGKRKSDASLTVQIDNFDIGVLVNRTKPESKMGGLVDVDVALTASASTLDQLMASGNGHFDFSGRMTDLEAGVLDLWAVNLVAAIISKASEEKSQINCAVGKWSVIDGLLTPEVFLVDTSKMRICGSGRVDLKDRYLDLTIAPKAKRAEFFSLATPLRVRGDFNDLGFGITSGGLVGTAFRFVTSPVTTPIKRVILDKIPADGSDVCTMPLGKENRSKEEVPGC